MIYSELYRQNFYDRYNFKVIDVSTAEQITLDEARDHLRITPFGSPPEHEEDNWLTSNISVAREWCEGWSMCALVPQTLELGVMMFPNQYYAYWGNTRPSGIFHPYTLEDNGILLPMAAPLVDIVSVIYTDSDGQAITMDPNDYYVNDYSKPAVLYPQPGTTWPQVQMQKRNAVRIRYACGYSLAGDSPQVAPSLPHSFRAAMLLVLGHLYENRENTMEIALEEIPLGAQGLMERYRTNLGMA